MIPDTFIRESRLKVFMELPWVLPSSVLLEFTDEDLDNLAAAPTTDEYWHTLNAVVTRIEGDAHREGSMFQNMLPSRSKRVGCQVP